MKIEFIYTKSSCGHCNNEFHKIIELLSEYPDVDEFVKYDLFSMDYQTIYNLASKYGFLQIPMIIVDGFVLFRKIPSIMDLYKTLEKYKKNECKAIDQNQILLY